MSDNLWKLLKNSTISIPRLLILQYKNLKLTDQQLIILIYLLGVEGKSFNPKQMGIDLKLSLEETMDVISTLTTMGYVKLELKKFGNMRDEIVNLDGLYQKLVYIVVNGETLEEKKNVSNVFETFEKEFGRTLSSMEYEIINAWLDGDYTEELVLLALKEAIYNGVFNLRYIDRILHNWYKKGVRSALDVEKEKKVFQNKKTTEVFDYDWLNENN